MIAICYYLMCLSLRQVDSVARKMANLKQILSDALALAEFSNLERGDLGRFRQKHPEFVPLRWWTCHPVGQDLEQWRFNQDVLRQAWKKNGFSQDLNFVMMIVMSVFDPQEMTDVFASVDGQLHSRYANLDATSPGQYPHQRAVLFLFEHPWRARFCPMCNKRFVAAEPKNKFCGEACSHESSRRRHNEWARKNLKAWRKKRKLNSK